PSGLTISYAAPMTIVGISLPLHDALPISATCSTSPRSSPRPSTPVSEFAPASPSGPRHPCGAGVRRIQAYPCRRHVHCIPESRRSEEHTSELQSRFDIVCRLLLERKNQEY